MNERVCLDHFILRIMLSYLANDGESRISRIDG